MDNFIHLIEQLKEELNEFATHEKDSKKFNTILSKINKLQDTFATNQEQERETKHKDSTDMTGSVLGDGSVTAGGDIVSGDKISIVLPNLAQKEEEKLDLTSYLLRLIHSCNRLDLKGIKNARFKRGPKNISDVFIPLCVKHKVYEGTNQIGEKYRIPKTDENENLPETVANWEIMPMKVFEFIENNKHVALLGNTGSGKTTTVNYCIYHLCSSILYSNNNLLKENGLIRLSQEAPIPIKISLNEFIKSDCFGVSSRNILSFIKLVLSPFDEAYYPLLKALKSKKAIVLFDSLDVLNEKSGTITIKAIQDFVKNFPENRFIVTCRTADYEKWELISFSKTEIIDLDKKQIDFFIERWYSDERIASELSSSINNSDLKELAKKPLLLTQIAVLHSSYGKLPDNYTNLFEEITKLLLTRWENRQSPDDSFSKYLGSNHISILTLESALLELAFNTYLESQFLDFTQATALNVFHKYFNNDWGIAQKFCDYIESKSGLIQISNNQNMRFLHTSLHEFLVAKYLTLKNDYNSYSADLIINNPEKWKNIFALSVRIAGTDRGISAINSICFLPQSKDEFLNQEQILIYLIAGIALTGIDEIQIKQRPERIEIHHKVLLNLQKIINNHEIKNTYRIEAAEIVSKLNYKDQGTTTLEPILILINKGFFKMSPISDKTNNSSVDFNIDYDYHICKYPITQAQYSFFISENPSYQIPEGDPMYNWSKTHRTPPKTILNHPVVLVSWYNAQQYCQWLSKKLANITDKYEVRLPTYAEWEKAYKGGVFLQNNKPNNSPNRKFPWGNNPSSEYINDGLNTFSTSFVGLYTHLVSPYGICDMYMNVMEWSQTSWGSENPEKSGFKDYYDPQETRDNLDISGYRILHGSSWLFSDNEAKCACRLDPNSKFADVGFRVVIAPKININNKI